MGLRGGGRGRRVANDGEGGASASWLGGDGDIGMSGGDATSGCCVCDVQLCYEHRALLTARALGIGGCSQQSI